MSDAYRQNKTTYLIICILQSFFYKISASVYPTMQPTLSLHQTMADDYSLNVKKENTFETGMVNGKTLYNFHNVYKLFFDSRKKAQK